MNCLILFSGKYKKLSPTCRQLNYRLSHHTVRVQLDLIMKKGKTSPKLNIKIPKKDDSHATWPIFDTKKRLADLKRQDKTALHKEIERKIRRGAITEMPQNMAKREQSPVARYTVRKNLSIFPFGFTVRLCSVNFTLSGYLLYYFAVCFHDIKSICFNFYYFFYYPS